MKRGFLNTSKAMKKPLYQKPHEKQQTSASPAAASEFECASTTSIGIESVDSDEVTMINVTIPPRSIDKPDDPDGHSEWIVKRPTIRKAIQAPGFPKPVPKPHIPNLCIVKQTSNMGMGLFVTVDVKAGELVVSERPLLVSPKTFAFQETEQKFEVSVQRMNDDDRKEYMSLWNNHKEDKDRPLFGISRTNAYGINLWDGPVKHSSSIYGAVGKLASRINHSCSPNVYQEFEVPSFSIQFKARRNITAGEQIFYPYCTIDQSAAHRQRNLAPYGFICTCTACTNVTPESDKLRKEFANQIGMDIISFSQACRNNAAIPESFVAELVNLQNAMIKEGLDSLDPYRDLLGLMEVAYIKIGNQNKAREVRGMVGYRKLGDK